VRLSWIQGPAAPRSTRLVAGVHIAGVHLLDEASGQYNLPLVRRRFPDRRMLLVNLASWEQGIVVARQPLKIRAAADLLRPRVRFVARESALVPQAPRARLRSQHGASAT